MSTIGMNKAMFLYHHASGRGAASKPSVGINWERSMTPSTAAHAQNPYKLAPVVVAKRDVELSNRQALNSMSAALKTNIAISAKLRRSPYRSLLSMVLDGRMMRVSETVA